MDTLVLDGKTFIKASSAAKKLGYTSDYIGQLSRAGKIDAHLVGRSWYVNEDQLRNHKSEKRRSTRAKTKQQVRKSVSELREKRLSVESDDAKAYESHITYESDENELLPQVKKISVQSTSKKKKSRKKREQASGRKEQKEEPNYTIENAGEKIKMSGVLNVLDATDEDLLDEDVVTLRAKIIKKRNTENKNERPNKEIKVISDKGDAKSVKAEKQSKDDAPRKTDFMSKLVALDAAEHERDPSQEKEQQEQGEQGEEGEQLESEEIDYERDSKQQALQLQSASRKSIWLSPILYVCVFCLLIAGAFVLVESSWTYTTEDAYEQTSDSIEVNYSVDASDVRGILKNK